MAVDEEQLGRDRAALQRLVDEYDLRWDRDPSRRYPVQFDVVGEGWAELLEELVAELLALGWDRRVAQVKEKFGMLRFYIADGTDAVLDAIDRAMQRSTTICERCGAPGQLDEESYTVRCAQHRERAALPVPVKMAGMLVPTKPGGGN